MPKKILPIAELGCGVLRTKAQSVLSPEDLAIQELIDNMVFTCEKGGGVGIAAPQVHQSLRILVISSKQTAAYPNAPEMEPLAMVNPKIISTSTRQERGWEGCFSIPGIRGIVPRYRTVRVAFTDRNGKKQRKTFRGFVARVFQHEFDHLEGILFLDRADPESLATDKEYFRIVTETKPKKKN